MKTSSILFATSAVALLVAYLTIVLMPFDNIDWVFVGMMEVSVVGVFFLAVIKDRKGE
jgi:hypothetical protein